MLTIPSQAPLPPPGTSQTPLLILLIHLHYSNTSMLTIPSQVYNPPPATSHTLYYSNSNTGNTSMLTIPSQASLPPPGTSQTPLWILLSAE